MRCVSTEKGPKSARPFFLGYVSHSLVNVVELRNTQETSSQAAKP